MKTLKIPEATIIRLSVYSRFLAQAERRGTPTISSEEIAKGVGGSPAQVRKDLAYFGEFGTRGVGYNVKDLNRHILKILGLSNVWSVIIVGAGNLGSALSLYRGFQERGFNIVAIFDNDESKIGQKLNGIEIFHTNRLQEIVEKHQVQMGILAVPAAYAQELAELLVEVGIKAILNFAPQVLNLPDHIEVRNVDLTVNLEVLTFNLALKQAKS